MTEEAKHQTVLGYNISELHSEVSSSNPDRVTDCPDLRLSWILAVPADEFGDGSLQQKGTIAAFCALFISFRG
jgi:hypothetical protein